MPPRLPPRVSRPIDTRQDGPRDAGAFQFLGCLLPLLALGAMVDVAGVVGAQLARGGPRQVVGAGFLFGAAGCLVLVHRATEPAPRWLRLVARVVAILAASVVLLAVLFQLWGDS